MTGLQFFNFFLKRYGLSPSNPHRWAYLSSRELGISRHTIHRLAISAKIPDKYAAKVEKLKGNKP